MWAIKGSFVEKIKVKEERLGTSIGPRVIDELQG
jgi:hypothetical protein